jgi:hypothetical protein
LAPITSDSDITSSPAKRHHLDNAIAAPAHRGVNKALAREESMRYCDDRIEWLKEGKDDENACSCLSSNERRKNGIFSGGAL